MPRAGDPMPPRAQAASALERRGTTSRALQVARAGIAPTPLRRAGVVMSVNTDDPVLLGASLEGEYALCCAVFGWSDEVLRALARNSIEASFASAAIKAKLARAVSAW